MKKPGKIFFTLLYIVFSVLLAILLFWWIKPDIFSLIKLKDLDGVYDRLVLFSGIFIIPSYALLKGKKWVSIKRAAVLSGVWVTVMFLITLISYSVTEKIVDKLGYITKPVLFLAISAMWVNSVLELFNTGEKKR